MSLWMKKQGHTTALTIKNRKKIKSISERGYLMKINEMVLTVLQIAAPVYCFAIGLPTQGWFLVAWIVFFGITELVIKAKTGKTLSQWVWTKNKVERIILSILMIAGMMALGYHLIFGGGAQ